MSFDKFRLTRRSEELERDINNLQSKLVDDDLSSIAINEISDLINSKKMDLKEIRENPIMDIVYMTYDEDE